MNSCEKNESRGAKASFTFSPKQKVWLFFKRAIDIFGSFIGIILLGLPMLVIAIATRCTSKGPAIFKQKRLGKNEKPFLLLKFRSMRADAPNIAPDDLTHEEQEAMITKFGHFLRRTSLDELPQLFNIFVGHMSFIGPRPQQDEEHEKKLYDARKSCEPDSFLVRPGLCGLAIVKMHRSHDPMEKARYDSEYVRDLSLGMDVKIFFIAFGILLGFNKKDRGR